MLSWPHDQAVHNAYSSFLCCSGVSKCFHKTRSALSHENTKNHILQILLVQEDVCKKNLSSILSGFSKHSSQVESPSSWHHVITGSYFLSTTGEPEQPSVRIPNTSDHTYNVFIIATTHDRTVIFFVDDRRVRTADRDAEALTRKAAAPGWSRRRTAACNRSVS